MARLGQASFDELANLVSIAPILVPRALTIYSESASYDRANETGRQVILLLVPFFWEDDVFTVLGAAA